MDEYLLEWLMNISLPPLVVALTCFLTSRTKGISHMFYGQRVMDIPDGLLKWSVALLKTARRACEGI